MGSRKPHPISTLRRAELMSAELRAKVQACQACEPDADHPGFVRLCGEHIIEDVWERL